jgi:hypothetical protein
MSLRWISTTLLGLAILVASSSRADAAVQPEESIIEITGIGQSNVLASQGHSGYPPAGTVWTAANGFCWLAGVESGNGAFVSGGNMNDYLIVTFDSNWNWVVNGSVFDGTSPYIFAWVFCEPYNQLSSSGNINENFGAEFGTGSGTFDTQNVDKYCNISGMTNNPFYTTQNAVGATFFYMQPNGTWFNQNPPVDFFSNCINFRNGQSAPSVTGGTAYASGSPRTYNLGSSRNQICGLDAIFAYRGFDPAAAWIDIDSSGNYILHAGAGLGSGDVGASCISVPQP